MFKKIFVFLSLSLPIFYQIIIAVQINGVKTNVVTIGGITKKMGKGVSCAVSKWGNSKENACRCCVMKQVLKTTGKISSVDKLLDHCIKKKHCTADLLNQISQKEGVSPKSEELIKSIYDEATIIKHVEVSKAWTDSNGNLTEQGLTQFLSKAYSEGKLKDLNFKNANCLNAKDLLAKSEAKGAHTLQLFLVKSTCKGVEANFIIKEMGKGRTESANLEIILNYPGMRDLVIKNGDKTPDNFPALAIPIAYLSYSFKGKNKYLAIMPSAKGMPLGNFILQYAKNPSDQNEVLIKNAYKSLGEKLANFHRKFMKPAKGAIVGKTIVHGDLHPFNIFYDENSNKITFIDNETMALYIKKPGEIYIDFMKIHYVPIALIKVSAKGLEFRDLIKGINLEKWMNISFGPFIEGYLQAYSNFNNEQKAELLKYLKKSFNTTPLLMLTLKAGGALLNVFKINSLTKDYINPMLDKLIKSYEKK